MGTTGYIISCGSADTYRTNSRPEIGYSHCMGTEICLDIPESGVKTAWCVAKARAAFEEVLPTSLNSVRTITVDGADRSGGESVQIVLTLSGRDVVVSRALQITIVPVDRDGKAVATPTTCLNCDSLAYPNTPRRTATLDIHVIMPRTAWPTTVYGYVWYNEPDGVSDTGTSSD